MEEPPVQKRLWERFAKKRNHVEAQTRLALAVNVAESRWRIKTKLLLLLLSAQSGNTHGVVESLECKQSDVNKSNSKLIFFNFLLQF